MSSKDVSIQKENIRLHKAQAAFYEVTHPEIFNVFEQKRLKREIELVTEDLHGKENVVCLDLGSGTGNIARHLQHLNLNVLSCDLSIQMLRRNPSKHKVCCDASHLPFKDGAFGLVTTYAFFHHIPNSLTTTKEIIRILGKKSKFYFDHDPFDLDPLVVSDTCKSNRTASVWMFNWRNLFGVFSWYLVNMQFLPSLVKYVVIRGSYRQFIEGIDGERAEENPIPTYEMIKLLQEKGFRVQLEKYGDACLFRGQRTI